MNKQEIQQEIKETRERLEALEAKLNEPEKWKPKGGVWRVSTSGSTAFKVLEDYGICVEEFPARAKTEEESKDLSAHLKRQAILWQLANDLNKGWKPDLSRSEHDGYEVYLLDREVWACDMCANVSLPYVLFKDEETAEKACDILNNQPELME